MAAQDEIVDTIIAIQDDMAQKKDSLVLARK